MPVTEPRRPKCRGRSTLAPLKQNRDNRLSYIVGILVAALVLVAMLWSLWGELKPDQERAVRIRVQDQLQQRFPEAMHPAPGYYGVFPATASSGTTRAVDVVLVHGLDEPGSIWDDLVPALSKAGFTSWEFRYPNDQGIDRSADLLAASWGALPDDRPMVLIGHSMGGLVIRDFVTRWRHATAVPEVLAGPQVSRVILVGTPNQGSDWARMRFWLEPRDQLTAIREQRFSMLSGLQDGTGVAQTNLRPGSRFLDNLNTPPCPTEVPLWIIGGLLAPAAPVLGDGVVSVDSLALEGAAAPILVAGSHRGMLKRLSESAQEPAAIPLILELLKDSSEP